VVLEVKKVLDISSQTWYNEFKELEITINYRSLSWETTKKKSNGA